MKLNSWIYAFCGAFLLVSAAQAKDEVKDKPVTALKREYIQEHFPESTVTLSRATAANGLRESVDVPLVSWRDLPFQTVKRQALDYSCGSAAVSTLLTYIYDTKTSEAAVFKDMFELGDKDKIRSEGFSLLDMSAYLQRNGYNAVGYKMGLDVVEKNKAPFIGLINNEGYNHFVTVKSVKGPLVLVGDPNKGNVIYHRKTFETMWNGIALIVTNQAHKARQTFDDPKEWRHARRLVSPDEMDYHGMGQAVMANAPWQMAPVRTDLLGSVNQIATDLLTP